MRRLLPTAKTTLHLAYDHDHRRKSLRFGPRLDDPISPGQARASIVRRTRSHQRSATKRLRPHHIRGALASHRRRSPAPAPLPRISEPIPRGRRAPTGRARLHRHGHRRRAVPGLNTPRSRRRGRGTRPVIWGWSGPVAQPHAPARTRRNSPKSGEKAVSYQRQDPDGSKNRSAVHMLDSNQSIVVPVGLNRHIDESVSTFFP